MGAGAGLYMYVVVVQKFTFAISSPDMSSCQYIGDWSAVWTRFRNYSRDPVSKSRHSSPSQPSWPNLHVLGNNVVQYCCRWFFHA